MQRTSLQLALSDWLASAGAGRQDINRASNLAEADRLIRAQVARLTRPGLVERLLGT